jgi:hypothetical protein
MIATYEDIHAIERTRIGPCHLQEGFYIINPELRATALDKFQENDERELVYLYAWRHDEPGIEVLFFPKLDRAAVARVAHNGEVYCTDASDADDALERFLGVNGKRKEE